MRLLNTRVQHCCNALPKLLPSCVLAHPSAFRNGPFPVRPPHADGNEAQRKALWTLATRARVDLGADGDVLCPPLECGLVNVPQGTVMKQIAGLYR